MFTPRLMLPDFTMRADLSGGADFFIARRINAGGADDMDDAGLGGKFHQRERRRRHGEINNAVNGLEQRCGIIGNLDARRAHGAAHKRRALGLKPARHRAARGFLE